MRVRSSRSSISRASSSTLRRIIASSAAHVGRGRRRPRRLDDQRQHRRQRRAQLVAQDREEPVLGLVGGPGLLLGVPQRLFGPPAALQGLGGHLRFGEELALALGGPLPGPALLQPGADAAAELVRIEGIGEEVVGPGFQSFGAGLAVPQEDHGQAVALVQQVEPALMQVGDHQVRTQVRGPTLGLIDTEAVQGRAHPLPAFRVGIDDQDEGLLKRHSLLPLRGQNGGLERLQVDRLGQVGDEPRLAALADVLLHAEAAQGDAPAGRRRRSSRIRSRPLPSGRPRSLMTRSKSKSASAAAASARRGRRGRPSSPRGRRGAGAGP